MQPFLCIRQTKSAFIKKIEFVWVLTRDKVKVCLGVLHKLLCGVNRSPYGFTNTFLVHDPFSMLCLKDLQIVLKLTCTFAKLASVFFTTLK